EHDERCRRRVERRRSPRLLLPDIALPLVEKAVLRGGNNLARRAAIIAVIGLPPPGQRHHRAMVKIIVPQRVEPIAAAPLRADEARLLRFVLADEDCAAP